MATYLYKKNTEYHNSNDSDADALRDRIVVPEALAKQRMPDTNTTKNLLQLFKVVVMFLATTLFVMIETDTRVSHKYLAPLTCNK